MLGKKIILKTLKTSNSNIFSSKGRHSAGSETQAAKSPKPYHIPEINPHIPPTIAPAVFHFIISSKNFFLQEIFG